MGEKSVSKSQSKDFSVDSQKNFNNDLSPFVCVKSSELSGNIKAVLKEKKLELPTIESKRALTPNRGDFVSVTQDEAESLALSKAHKCDKEQRREICEGLVDIVGNYEKTMMVKNLVDDIVEDVSGEPTGDTEDHFQRFRDFAEDEVKDITDIITNMPDFHRTMKIRSAKKKPIRLLLPHDLAARFYSICERWALNAVETVLLLLGEIKETKEEVIVLVNKFVLTDQKADQMNCTVELEDLTEAQRKKLVAIIHSHIFEGVYLSYIDVHNLKKLMAFNLCSVKFPSITHIFFFLWLSNIFFYLFNF